MAHNKPRKPTKTPPASTPTPPRLARLLVRQRTLAALVVVLLIVAIALVDRAGGLLPVNDDWHRYHGRRFEVVRVIDGDTLDLRVRDGRYPTTRVRLWGVDAPEIAHEPGEVAEPGADAATAYLRDQAQGATVILRLQDHRMRGRYGRLLAYVELPDGSDLNAGLIEQGLAKADDRWGHDRADRYLALQRKAKAAGRGVWSK